MRNVRRAHVRAIAVATAIVLLTAACSNSKSQTKKKQVLTTSPSKLVVLSQSGLNTKVQSGPLTPGDIKKFVHISGVRGVDDHFINTTAVISVTNAIGGEWAQLIDGVNAYFNMVNAQGGIYGRHLRNVKIRDDNGVNNLQETQNSLSQDNAFANFGATYIQFSGAGALDQAGQPAFTWNINPETAGHNNIFSNETALCFNCGGPTIPWLAKQLHRHKVGILGYSVPSSAQCGEGDKASFKQYDSGAKVVYTDFSLQFGQQVTAQVAKMKQAGVDFVLTCMDLHETAILGREMKKQKLNAIQALPNAYDAAYIKANSDAYEGDYVAPQYVGLEHSPQIPEMKLFLSQLNKEHKKFVELSADGWILANMFVTGLELAGPNFTQQKLIDALNKVSNFSDNGMIVPENWSTGHVDPEKNPSVRAPQDCSNWDVIHSGNFVATFDQPNKPWVCIPRFNNNTVSNFSYTTFAPQG